jgi:membrane protein YdbS with pleckstrin-like domain
MDKLLFSAIHDPMSKVDIQKEKISYLRLWMGLALALAAGLISWFAGNWSSALKLQFYAAIATFVIIVLFALGMHIKIIKEINKLGDL